MRCGTKTLLWLWLSYVVFMSSASKNVGLTVTSVELQDRPVQVRVQCTLCSGKIHSFPAVIEIGQSTGKSAGRLAGC